MIRFDNVEFKAVKTEEGFIKDCPVIGRTGILTYAQPDGTIRTEYRPPEEAFAEDSLRSIEAKPITIGHHGLVTSGNAKQIKPVGTVLSKAKQDGDNIRADVVIYNLDCNERDLSCGYSLDLDETPGVTPSGERYDAVQRNIRYNHLAIVPKGRAGNARLNFDGEQIFEENNEDKMDKLKLENGIEYEVPAEVKVAFEAVTTEKEEVKKAKDKAEAERDAAIADKDKAIEDLENAQKDGVGSDNFNEEVKKRVALLDTAKKAGVEQADEMDEQAIKCAVINSVRGDSVELADKSVDYINAAFDLCKDDAIKRQDAMDKQKRSINSDKREDGSIEEELTTIQLMEKLREDESQLYMKEV